MKINVGELRRQCALQDADTRVEIVTDDPVLNRTLSFFEIEAFYPDAINEAGKWQPTFKLKLRRKPGLSTV